MGLLADIRLSPLSFPRAQPHPNYYNSPMVCIYLTSKRLTVILKSPCGSASRASGDTSRSLFLQAIHIYIVFHYHNYTIPQPQSQQLFSYENLTNLLRLCPSSRANDYFLKTYCIYSLYMLL